MLIEPGLHLFGVEPDGSADAVVGDLAMLRQIVNVLPCESSHLRDYCGADQFRKREYVRIAFQSNLPISDCRRAAPGPPLGVRLLPVCGIGRSKPK